MKNPYTILNPKEKKWNNITESDISHVENNYDDNQEENVKTSMSNICGLYYKLAKQPLPENVSKKLDLAEKELKSKEIKIYDVRDVWYNGKYQLRAETDYNSIGEVEKINDKWYIKSNDLVQACNWYFKPSKSTKSFSEEEKTLMDNMGILKRLIRCIKNTDQYENIMPVKLPKKDK